MCNLHSITTNQAAIIALVRSLASESPSPQVAAVALANG